MNFGAGLGGMNVLLAVNVASLERGGWQNLPLGRICDCQKYDETRQRLQQRVVGVVCPLKLKTTRAELEGMCHHCPRSDFSF